MKSILVFLCLALAVGSGLAQEPDFAPPTGQDGRPLIPPARWESLRAILPRAFTALMPNEDPSGKKAMKSIRQNLAMSESATDAAARQIDEMVRTTGAYAAYDLAGVQALPRGERLYRLAYLTYGAKAPAFWEATVYLSDSGWKVMDLSIVADKIFDKAQGYR
jgi:hypothetical protein